MPVRPSGGFFPLGFRGEVLAGRGTVGFGIVPAHLHDRVRLQAGNTTALTSGDAPVGMIRNLGPCLRQGGRLPRRLYPLGLFLHRRTDPLKHLRDGEIRHGQVPQEMFGVRAIAPGPVNSDGARGGRIGEQRPTPDRVGQLASGV